MIKILFLINTLGGGGAERVLVNLINNMDSSKFDITVETMFSDGVNKKFLNKNVKCINKNPLNIRGLSSLIKYIPANLLYKYYVGKNDYDILVAYMHGAPTKVISGCSDKKIKKVTWLHYGNPKEGSFFRFWLSNRKAFDAYDLMDGIVGVSKSVSDAFSDYTGIVHNKFTLYNTNDTERVLNLANEPIDYFENKKYQIICSSGRLSKQKGFDRLIRVSRKLRDENHKFQIIIMGSGPEENSLKNLIHKMGVDDYVHLLGFCENPYNIMANSDFYISSSREEGLATVLTEALTVGIPVISTDVSGAKEVLGNNNEYGLVVENNEAGIYHGLKLFLTDKDKVEYYKKVSRERAIFFDTEHTVKKTEEFFKNLLK